MSDDLDRKIALSIEPMPTWTYPPDDGTAISDGRAWLVYFKGGAVYAQKPRSFKTEPEMTLLLLERMGRTGNRDVQLWIGADDKWHCQTYLNISVIHELLSEAVRLAYARAEGLE